MRTTIVLNSIRSEVEETIQLLEIFYKNDPIHIFDSLYVIKQLKLLLEIGKFDEGNDAKPFATYIREQIKFIEAIGPGTYKFCDLLHTILIFIMILNPLNDEDPITLEKIPFDKEFVSSEGHLFNIESLQKWAEGKDKVINPCTGIEFCNRDIARLKKDIQLRNQMVIAEQKIVDKENNDAKRVLSSDFSDYLQLLDDYQRQKNMNLPSYHRNSKDYDHLMQLLRPRSPSFSFREDPDRIKRFQYKQTEYTKKTLNDLFMSNINQNQCENKAENNQPIEQKQGIQESKINGLSLFSQNNISEDKNDCEWKKVRVVPYGIRYRNEGRNSELMIDADVDGMSVSITTKAKPAYLAIKAICEEQKIESAELKLTTYENIENGNNSITALSYNVELIQKFLSIIDSWYSLGDNINKAILEYLNEQGYENQNAAQNSPRIASMD